MRIRLLSVLFYILTLISCRPYLDLEKNNISNDGMKFDFKKDYNEFDYFNKINGRADDHVFYNTHFTIRLPKAMVNWLIEGNHFYFEYASRQLIYIYSEYKNMGNDSLEWEYKDIRGKVNNYVNYKYAASGRYDYDYFSKTGAGRVSKLYTNGKYIIVLYNVKDKNISMFTDFVKTFKLK